MALRVGLGDDGQEFSRPRLRQLESEAHDALDTRTRQDRNIRCDFERQAPVHAAADAGIFAFRIFADDDPVELLAMHIAQRTGDRSEEHTSELQSLTNLVCRLLLEKKKHE